MLFDLDTPCDLACRGFGREEILSLTGVDTGYHTNSLRGETMGVDRVAYKREHVSERLDDDAVLDVLARYGRCEIDVAGVLSELGLSNPNVCKLRKIFAGTRFEAAFRDADRAYRRHNMKSGFAAAHDGVDNPFKLAQYQEAAANTREERYGGRYTLAAGSTKAAEARATFAEHMADEDFRVDLQAKKSAACMAHYGVEHPMQNDEVKAKAGLSRALSGNMTLCQEGSTSDLFFRGWPVSEARRKSGDGCKKSARQLGASHRLAYSVAHIRTRVGIERFSEAMAAYGRDECNIEGIFDRIGLKRTNDVSISRLANAFGLGDSWKAACAALQVIRSESTADMWEERYGVRNISQLDTIKERKRATTREHYGVDVSLCSPEVRAKAKATIRERYGVDNVSQSDEIKGRKIETSRAHYGTDYPQQSDEVRKAQSDTLKERFGIRSDEVVYPFQIADVRQKAADSCESSLGVRNPFESAEVQAGIRDVWVREYGVTNPSQVPEVREHREQTMIRRYGVRNFMELDGSVGAIRDTKRRNGTLSGSSVETLVGAIFADMFGEDDVVTQYDRDARYPFACDFYVKSRDLFVELNGLWAHGGHWYSGDVSDAARLAAWRDKGSPYYAKAANTWSARDIAKRAAAAKARLNYVVFWDGSDHIEDVRLWLAMGCPDGRDWEREYSWLPKRELSLVTMAPKLTGTASSAVKVARWANGDVFYARELVMWKENSYQKVWGTLQACLYANRYKYLRSGTGGSGLYEGKLPDELSDLEIVRGLGIMGKVRAYSTFDNSAMVDVIGRYGVTSVLDPCAGWGERLATCCGLGLPYLGIDVNERLFAGYDRIISQYGDAACQRCVCADAAEVSIDGEFDSVITCPPYGLLERYSDAGAENLGEDEFSAWWERVAVNVGAYASRLFCVQTNQACKDVFTSGLEAHGWYLVESVALNKRSSHMTRKRGGVNLKREFEEMLVFERVREFVY